MLLNRNVFLVMCLLILPASTTAYGAADADGFYEIRNGGGRFIEILESLPYVTEGSGPVMFTFEYSECPYCQGMYRDYKAGDTGLTHRRVFVPVSDRSARETAAMGKSRDIQDYHAFMTGRKQAPVFSNDSASVQAYNAVISGTDEIETILKQNEWPLPGFRFPQFVWIENGKVFTSAGYEKSDFGRAVARAQKGGGTADIWTRTAGGKAPAPAAAPAAASTTPRQSSGMDVIGLEIGMTKDEVIAAIKAHDPRVRIDEHPVKIVVYDSNRQQLEVGSYVKAIQVWIGHGQGIEGFNLYEEPTERIVVYFSPPPAEHRVEFIGREVTYPVGKGPDFDVAMQSIIQKYGEPAEKLDQRSGPAQIGPVTQFWQQSGPSLKGQQFVRFSNKSGIMAPLSLKTGNFHPVGGQRPPVTEDRTGLSLGIMVNKQGHLVHMMRFMLSADKQTIEQNQAATWDLGVAALQQHEQKVLGAAQQRGGPKL